MDIYTLSDAFLAKDVVDEFISAIWTERYSSAGDAQLVVAPTARNLEMLKEGTYLSVRGSQEVAEIETLNIEEGVVKITAKMLEEAVLMQRFLWAHNPLAYDTSDERVVDFTLATLKPGEFVSELVTRWAISPTAFPSLNSQMYKANLDWTHEEIDRLTLGAVDHSGTVQRITAPIGPLYEAVKTVAEQFGVGTSLYLESADPVAGYQLKFKTYQGVDRTSAQTVVPLVRLTPDLDDISDIKEIRSNALFKNVVYVWYQGQITKFLADPTEPEPEGLARRVLVTDAVGEPVGRKGLMGGGSSWNQPVIEPADVDAFLAQNAKDALANHNYIHTIDGQTSPISDYKFGVDYGLGDLIELEGLTGAVSKARITEYIRAQDRTGERSYPTISVVS